METIKSNDKENLTGFGSEYLTYKEWKHVQFRYGYIRRAREYLTYKEWKLIKGEVEGHYNAKSEYLTYKEWKPSLPQTYGHLLQTVSTLPIRNGNND